jgi:hypothetical protein
MNKKVNLFLKKSCVFYAHDDQTFFDPRQVVITRLILNVLESLRINKTVEHKDKTYGKHGTIMAKDLYILVETLFQEHLISVINQYESKPDIIISAGYKWLLMINPKENKYVTKNLGHQAFSKVLWRINPNFISIKQIGSQSNKEREIHTLYNIRISKQGTELLNAWREKDEGNN